MTATALLRGAVRRAHRAVMARLATPLEEEELRRPAMVFAPHPDDETLGCGGTILRKREVGAEVWIACLTDGSASHAHLVPREELSALRAREWVEATEALNVEAPRLLWLGFPDGGLRAHHEEAVSRVAALLETHRPEQLFVPYARGEHPDHVATNAIVHEAVRRVGSMPTIFEYPVWFWRHWPNIGLGRSWPEVKGILAGSLKAGFGLRLLLEFRTRVSVRELIAQKRVALARHASQVQRREGVPGWRTLGDISDGEFLACFFQAHEFYRRAEV